MLYDRGYLIPYLLEDGTNDRMPVKHDREWFDGKFKRGRPDLASVFRHKQTAQRIYVMFESGDIGKARLKELIARFAADVTQCIFVLSQKPTAEARKILHEMNVEPDSRVHLEWFYEDEMLVNRIEDGVSILQGDRSKLTSIPRISEDDWIARYLGARIGDVIRIRRPSESAGRYTNYREVTRRELLPKEAPLKRRHV
jgi:DNA-directed RNA polymerase subunit H (RpoH/RPB5)